MSDFLTKEEQAAFAEQHEQKMRGLAKQVIAYYDSLPADANPTYGEIMDATGINISDLCEIHVSRLSYVLNMNSDIPRYALSNPDGSRKELERSQGEYVALLAWQQHRERVKQSTNQSENNDGN